MFLSPYRYRKEKRYRCPPSCRFEILGIINMAIHQCAGYSFSATQIIIKICVCVHYKVCESVILGMCNRGLRHACSAPNGKSHAVIISVIILHIMYHCLMLATHRVYSSHCTSYCTVLASIVPCRQTVVWPECVGGISSEISNCPSMGEGKPMQLDSISPTVSICTRRDNYLM